MKKILLVLLLLLLLTSCTSMSPEDYHIISKNPVDGYDIYEYDHDSIFCNTYYEDVYYSDETYNNGFTIKGCSQDMTFFIKQNDTFIYIEEALNLGIITIESLLPELTQLERESEEFSNEEADYLWLGFFILGKVVYAYGGGECDQYGTEIFYINGKEYFYSATGCLKEHILYMQVDREYVPIATLIAGKEIDGLYLIPLLTESN